MNSLLVQARQLQTSDPLASIMLYEQVLAQEPENVEALTYRGWTAAFVALGLPEGADRDVLVGSATTFLDQARTIDPSYPDAQCFTAIVRFRFAGDAEGAKEPLERCRAGDLPASVQGLVDALGSSIDDALAENGDADDDDRDHGDAVGGPPFLRRRSVLFDRWTRRHRRRRTTTRRRPPGYTAYDNPASVPQKTNGMSVASFVLSLVGVIPCFWGLQVAAACSASSSG